jgi:thiol-disulfide isomerase/thioredoxin
MGGGLLALSSLRGSPAILNFWASWCPSCVREMPAFQRIHTQFENRLQVVGFNALGVRGETKAFAKSYAEARGVTYEIAFDRNAVLYSHFAGTSLRPVLPLTVFADARGIVRKVSFGETTESDIRSTISQLFQIA